MMPATIGINNMDVMQQPVLFNAIQDPQPQIEKPSEPAAEKKKNYVKIESELLQQILNTQKECQKELAEQKERFDKQDKLIARLNSERKTLKKEKKDLKNENGRLIHASKMLNEENKILCDEKAAWPKQLKEELQKVEDGLQKEAEMELQKTRTELDGLKKNLASNQKTTNCLYTACSIMSIGCIGVMAWPIISPIVVPVVTFVTSPVVVIKSSLVAYTAQLTLSSCTTTKLV